MLCDIIDFFDSFNVFVAKRMVVEAVCINTQGSVFDYQGMVNKLERCLDKVNKLTVDVLLGRINELYKYIRRSLNSFEKAEFFAKELYGIKVKMKLMISKLVWLIFSYNIVLPIVKLVRLFYGCIKKVKRFA